MNNIPSGTFLFTDIEVEELNINGMAETPSHLCIRVIFTTHQRLLHSAA